MAIGRDPAAAVTAFNRFGLGAPPGDLEAVARGPRGLRLEELRTPDVALISDPAPPSGPEALRAFRLDKRAKKAARAARAAEALTMAASMSVEPGKAAGSTEP